jgi:hypothetical protein
MSEEFKKFFKEKATGLGETDWEYHVAKVSWDYQQEKIDKLESRIEKLRDSIDNAILQRGQNYGMDPDQAIKFRERRVFSYLEEALEADDKARGE